MDYYEILGINKDATQEDIKSAYRTLSKKYHPDVNDAPNAAAFFRLISEAYETLFDNDKRIEYDSFTNPPHSSTTEASASHDDNSKCFYHPTINAYGICPSCGEAVCAPCYISFPSNGKCMHCCGNEIILCDELPHHKRNIFISILIFPFVLILKLISCLLFVIFKTITLLLIVVSTIATFIGAAIAVLSVLVIVLMLFTNSFEWMSTLLLIGITFIGVFFSTIIEFLPIPFAVMQNFMGSIIKKKF